MEYSQFDNFVKKNTEEELTLPQGLEWDNMDIELPKKREQVFSPLLLLTLGFLGLIVGVLLLQKNYWHKEREGNTKVNTLNIDSKEDCQELIFVSNTVNEPTTVTIPVKPDAHLPLSTIAQPKKLELQQEEMIPPSTISPVDFINKIDNREIDYQSSSTPPTTIEKLSSKPIKALTFNPESKIEKRTPAIPKEELGKSVLTPKLTVAVSAGVNYGGMNYDKDKQRASSSSNWGSSYQLSVEYALKKNWFLSIGGAYDRIHSTLYNQQALGTYERIDSNVRSVILQTREVYHNNYYEMVALQLGVGKSFRLTDRWSGQIMLNIAPTYRRAFSGKVLDNSDEVLALEPNLLSAQNWSWTAGAGMRFTYRAGTTDLFLHLGMRRSISKIDVLTDSNLSSQPHLIHLSLGIRKDLSF